MFCHYCGAEVQDGAGFCHKCGTKLLQTNRVQSMAATEIADDENQKKPTEAADVAGQMNYVYSDEDEFRRYVDSYLQKKISKRSALERMDIHDVFIWVCFGIPVVLGVILLFAAGPGPGLGIWFISFMVFYLVVYIRNLTLKRVGQIPANASIDNLIEFLNGHLRYLSPHIHEWGCIKYKGQPGSSGRAVARGVMAGDLHRGLVMANQAMQTRAMMESAVMCAPIGKKQKWLLVIYMNSIKGKGADSEELACSIGIERRCSGKDSFLSAGPFSDAIGAATHTNLIKLRPIMQATMEYYLQNGMRSDYSQCRSVAVNTQPVQTTDAGNVPKESYDDGIKPYYREEFDKIAAGQKPRFNWSAFFLNGWNQLYNGCTKIFCKTFLPLQLALFAGSLMLTAGVLKANMAVIVIGAILVMVAGIGSLVLSILNGINFNKWFYRDVAANPGKKRSRKWLWIILVCEVAVYAISEILLSRMLLQSVNDYIADWSDGGFYGEEYGYGEDAIGKEVPDAGEGAADGNAFEAAGGAADGDATGSDEAGNGASEVATVAVDEASENAALQILADWFQRRPLMHNIKVEFMEEGLDAGDGTIYLPYIMYIEQEEYGFFVVNPDTGDMVMDSVLDDQGELVEIQVSMDQWYLEYYWGWTDDSGYHSEPYSDDIYEIYNGEGALILEYYSSHDSYAICDYDGRNFMEYDDGSAASEVVLADFAGSYWSDQSAEVEGTFVENGYGLEIGEWDGYCFSIAETWRGMDLLKDDWCVPQSLILNTLTFVTYSSEGGTHTLTYVPAEYSPLGQDVVYLDGDETMPFVRN